MGSEGWFMGLPGLPVVEKIWGFAQVLRVDKREECSETSVVIKF